MQNQLWYALPLVAAICLVYGATRHERMLPILNNAVRSAFWVIVFVASIYCLMFFLGWNL